MMATLPSSVEATGRTLRLVLIAATFLLVGAISALQPLIGVLAALTGFALWRGERLARDGMLLLLLGNVALTYSFANIGFNAGMPIPVTEMILLPLVGWCLLHSSYLRGLGSTGFLLAALILIATLRLLTDFPSYGSLAARDFITPLEALMLIAAFWSFNKYGFGWAIHTWKIVIVIAILYALLYPWGPRIAEMGPMVGLQKPVPLLGQYQGSGPAMAAAFFFCLLVMKGRWSLILGALSLGTIALFQARGLYLALPMATIVVMMLAGKTGNSLPPKLLGIFAVAVCVFVMIIPLNLQGRMGPLTFSFVTEQLGTLLGNEGVGDGSRDDRMIWLEKSWNDVTASPQTLLFGVGLGPDLTDGAMYNGEEAIRKPHNDFLEVFARFGLVGFAVWSALLASMLVPIWKATRSRFLQPNERSFLLWIVAGLTCYLFIATNQPLLAFPYGTIPVFTMLGMGLALSRQVLNRTTDPLEAASS